MQYLRVFVLILLLVAAGVVQAQDDEEGFTDLYPDLTTERAEDGAFVIGDSDAPVTIITFADFLCPHCQDYHEVSDDFIQTYVTSGQARFEYRFFPIIDNTYSPLMSIINECAHEQGAFWAAHDLLYDLAAERAIDANLATTVAETLGLDVEAMTTCVDGEGPFQFQEDELYGLDLGVTGTPAVRVRVGDSEAGIIVLEGVEYGRGGPGLDVLSAFVESARPEDLVRMPNQLLDETLLADTSLVDGEPCAAPCWRGITPGETTFDEAVAILEDEDDLLNIEVQEQNGAKLATWESTEGIPCCQMTSQDGEEITFLQLRTSPDSTFGEVIAAYGEPAYLEGVPYTRRQTIFNVYYPDLNWVVFVFAPGASEPLNEDSAVIGAVYLNTDVMMSVLENANLHAWEGYASLAEYDEGPFEITPGG